MQEGPWDSNFSLWFCNMCSKAFGIFSSFQLALDQNKTTFTDKKKWICMNFIAGKDVYERATSGQEVHVGCGGHLSHQTVHNTWLVNLISIASAAPWHNPHNMVLMLGHEVQSFIDLKEQNRKTHVLNSKFFYLLWWCEKCVLVKMCERVKRRKRNFPSYKP